MNRTYEPSFKNLTQLTGCSNTTDSLQCLRSLPFSELNAVVNTTQLSGVWAPQIDGDIFARHSSDQVAEGAFVKLPIIVGANSDEGTGFAPKGLNTTEQFLRALTCKPTFSSPTLQQRSRKVIQQRFAIS
jgi:carboxylesterase type B